MAHTIQPLGFSKRREATTAPTVEKAAATAGMASMASALRAAPNSVTETSRTASLGDER